ncbi:DnaD domain protein [Candidatus Xianfuyuplasma coldseepsis]|uniref:DnaD domain-containing protein n=1 Tax=Candidatus Xianfuyuplasma coldseepsis TaxID=2782163 RepID=A0A7L7KRU7_9MOLU|nr:DnaD domain protein [Xianfuyuplasma coldseepsis]QMS85550.1 hypothetical protein G4Z02_07280 [Xianfuyuplasma coldseepsis]
MDINGLDTFRLITYHTLDRDERNVLTLLYQPILGGDAFTLYLTLWSLIDRSTKKQTEFHHKLLYDAMRLSPRQFEQVRQKLEAIGLLVTYHNEDIYLYELKAPLTAEEFIKDGSLGAYLFSRLGKDLFDEISGLFKVTTTEKDGFTNISSTFDKVFDSLPKPIETKANYTSKSKAKIHINHAFDFELFLEGLSKNFVDRRKITNKVKEKIYNLSYVYNLDEFTMQKVFMDTVDKDRNIDLGELSKNARKWYEFDRDTIHHEDVQPSQDVVSHLDMLQKCKTVTPAVILGILSNGKPSLQELNVVERLIDNYNLSQEVINFLLVYVVGQLGEFPSYNYFDKVAVEWQRHHVSTIDDAIVVIKNRTKRMQSSKSSKQKNTIPNDIESDWFDEYWNNR